jgi:subtilisin family serine protease
MDPALWEMLEVGDGDDEVAAIVRLRGGETLPGGIRVISRFADIATCRLRRAAIPTVHAAEAVESLKAAVLLTPETDVPPSAAVPLLPDADVRRLDIQGDSLATGKGVVVGVLDWGLDIAHPDFRHPDGRTRLRALWDQRGQRRGDNNPYGYGRIYSADEINWALGHTDPYAALGYAPIDADPERVGSHGTHVASIAAGSSNGVAPDAELVFVHLTTLGTGRTTNLGDSVTILEAVDFVDHIAGEKPCVCNLSVGRCAGPHDGRTLVEMGLDAFVTAAPGRVICQSTGNYFDFKTHAEGRLRPGETHTLRVRVDAADVTPNELEVWYSGRDVFRARVVLTRRGSPYYSQPRRRSGFLRR